MMYFSRSTSGFYSTEIHGASIPSDAVEITAVKHIELLEAQSNGKRISSNANGFPVAFDPPSPTAEQVIASFTTAIQLRLDSFARTRGYDSILSAATYAASTVPKFAAEGQYAVTERDATWATCYSIMADVQSGARPMPTLEEIESELPVLEWPL